MMLAACWLALGAAMAADAPSTNQLQRFEFTELHMAVPFRIVLYAKDADTATQAAKAAYARIEQINEMMSDYVTDSELNELSATAGQDRWIKLSPDLWTVLSKAQSLAARSRGAFDVTVGPSVSQWRRARQKHTMPTPEALARARSLVGYRKLLLDPATRSAKLTVPDMRLDLGGIAKGYGVDEALRVLRMRGIERALVSGAGDLAVSEPPPGRPGWRIELAPLDVTNAPPARHVLIANQALATSGDFFQRLEIDGKRYSHIVDPRTGIGLTDHSMVTIIAPDCTTADAMATAASVLGPKQGMRLVRATPFAEARMVRKPKDKVEVLETARFKQYYEPVTPQVQAEKPEAQEKK